MKVFVIILMLSVYFWQYETNALSFPGPQVFVVTPSPRPQQMDGRSAPFYYHNWMRRMDSGPNITSTTTTSAPVKTPDLIFAEFESDGSDVRKSIRKLLEKEKITPKTTTTTTIKPIYVPDDEPDESGYGFQITNTEHKETSQYSESNDYFSMYNKLYGTAPAPVYKPSPSPSSTSPKIMTTTTSTTAAPLSVENIWHVIDSEKYNQYSGNWEEIAVTPSDENSSTDGTEESTTETNIEDSHLDENFALPGFGTNPGNGAENESRAIEQNIKFPYVNLKPFLMKNQQKRPLLNTISNNKKGNNQFMNLDHLYEIKNPVRGEAQDVVPMRQPIDRYNPAQPYLPQSYGNKYSKQSSVVVAPTQSTANLVPPPLPPVPKLTADDFPAPSSYESFPPYAAPGPDSGPVFSPPPPGPVAPAKPMFSAPVDMSSDSDSNTDDGAPVMDLGYRYKPPSPPAQAFFPTVAPVNKPFQGYSYNKPAPPVESPMMPPSMDEKPDFTGYHYNKPAPSDSAPFHHDTDYPELVFQKHHGDMDDSKDGDDMKGADLGMAPPTPPDDMKPDAHGAPMDDSGFPHDFPGDFKYHHDFDDHDFYHHHHHPTTTTTTTEMPRVNRYSYYYLGKKLYYLPLYFSVYFIIYVGALIIKAVLRHKIVYPNSWRPNDTTAAFFSKRSVDSYLSNENLHEITGKATHAIATAAEKYFTNKRKNN